MLANLAMRRRRQARENEKPSLSGASDFEGGKIGGARRRRKKRDCRHDPWAQEIAQIIMGAYYWISEPTYIKTALGNGLENTIWGRFCSNERSILLGMMGYRLMNFLMVQTYYVPDEYWQSLEVAHHQVFGTSGYLTWEWLAGIRGYLYPSIFTLLYKMLELAGIDTFLTVARLPGALQAMFYALSDLYLYKLSDKLAGPLVAQWTLLINCLSWFTCYCAPRTLTNTMETALITIALYYYPWNKKSAQSSDAWKFLWIAAISVSVRPTAAILWIPLCISHIIAMRRQVWSMLVLYTLTALAFGFITARIDKAFYGQWTVVHLNFFQVNIGKRISHIYGTHPWHWYVTQGLPFILSTHYPLLIAGWKKCKNRSIQAVLMWTVLVYSFLAHKEFRFVLPIVPIAMHVCGYYVTVLHQQWQVKDSSEGSVTVELVGEQLRQMKSDSKVKDGDSGLTASELSDSISESEIIENVSRRLNRKLTPRRPWLTPKAALIFLAVGNLPMMLYFSALHQRGAIDVVKFLHSESLHQPNMSALFLMPCHSTPYYSHIHTNITMRFLTCEPNLNETKNYVTEAQQFYNDPIKWLKTEVVKGPRRHVYTHVAMFDSLESKVEKFLSKGSYKLCSKHFYSYFPDEDEKSKHLKVFCRHS